MVTNFFWIDVSPGFMFFLNESSANMMLFIHSRDTIPLHYNYASHFTFTSRIFYSLYIQIVKEIGDQILLYSIAAKKRKTEKIVYI